MQKDNSLQPIGLAFVRLKITAWLVCKSYLNHIHHTNGQNIHVYVFVYIHHAS